MARAIQATELDQITPTLLRQTYAVRLLEMGLPEEAVACVLGISHLEIMKYNLVRKSSTSTESKLINFDQDWPIYGVIDL